MHVIIRFEKHCFILLSATFSFKTHQNTLLPIVWIKSKHLYRKHKPLHNPPQYLSQFLPAFYSFALYARHTELLPHLLRNSYSSLKTQLKCHLLYGVFLDSSSDSFLCVPIVYQSGPAWKQTVHPHG